MNPEPSPPMANTPSTAQNGMPMAIATNRGTPPMTKPTR